MSTVRNLHDRAMKIAQRAMVLRHNGYVSDAEHLAYQASELEKQAADLVPEGRESEPTRSILYRSAASLAYQAQAYDVAIELVEKGLLGYPPQQLEQELKALLDLAKAERSKHSNATDRGPSANFDVHQSRSSQYPIRDGNNMPLPGGPSDKISNRYEKRWTIYCLIKVMSGEYDTIHLEAPNEDKAEFVLHRDSEKHYHQSKRQLSGGNWTFSNLRSEGFIGAAASTIKEPNTYWVFVSSHPAPVLRELTENASASNDSREFQQSFVSSSKDKKRFFADIRTEWQAVNDESVYEGLKRITIITVDENILKELNSTLLRQYYDAKDIDAVVGILAQFIDDNIHKRVTAQDVWSHLDTSLTNVPRKAANPISQPSNRISQMLMDDVEQLSDLLSDHMSQRIDIIDQARREGIQDSFLEELRAVKQNMYYLRALNNPTRMKLLCLMAALELDIHKNLEQALTLIDEAKKIDASFERVRRMEAWIKAYKQGDFENALYLLNGTFEVSSLNLSAALHMETGQLTEAREVLENISEPDAETYRLQAIIALKSANIAEAQYYCKHANSLQSSWLSIRFIDAVLKFMETLTDTGIADYIKVWPFPPPIERSLVKLDKQSIRIYQDAGNLFQNLADNHPSEIKEPQIWRLACLVYNPSSYQKASEYCQHLLTINPSDAPSIMWGIVHSLDVDFSSTRLALENLYKTGKAQENQLLALAELYLHSQEYDLALQFLTSLRSNFEDTANYIIWLVRYIRVLLLHNNLESAKTILQESSLTPDERYSIDAILLGYDAHTTSDWTEFIDQLRNRFNKTQRPSDLLDLCQACLNAQEWSLLGKYIGTLRENIDTSDTVWMAILASYNTSAYEECLALINLYQQNFELVVPTKLLRNLEVSCYEAIGDLKQAIYVAQILLSDTSSIDNLNILAHLYYKIGNRPALEMLSQQLANFQITDGAIHLRFSQLLQKHDPERAIHLWREAIELGIPDELVGIAYLTAIQLGLQDRASDIFPRFASLAQRGIGAQVVSPQDVVNIRQEHNRFFEEVKTEYHKGTIPVHTYVDNTQVPLIAQYYFNFGADLDNSFMSRADTIFARHGAKPIIQVSPDVIKQTMLYADITAILTAYHLDVLDLIEDIFKPISIPQNLIQILSLMEQQMLNRVQEQRLKALNAIQDLIDQDTIKLIDTSDYDLPQELINLQSELMPSELALLYLAHEHGGFYVDYLPITKFTKALEIVPANIPSQWSKYIANREVVLEGLRTVITKKLYQNAREKFQRSGEPRTSQQIAAGTNLYFDSNVIEEFAVQGILDKLCQRFNVHISDHYQDWLRSEQSLANHADEMAKSLRKLIDHLNKGILKDVYQTLPSPSYKNIEDFGPTTESFVAFLEVPAGENRAIWVDDRFANGQRIGNNPTIGINDLLQAMRSIQELSDEDYYDYIIKLRSANLRYIPLEIDELLYHLKNAAELNDGFSETPELKVIRRYIAACMEAPSDIQYPIDINESQISQFNELTFVGSTKLTIYKIFPQIWSEVEDSGKRQQMALWVRDNLFFDYMAIVEHYHQQLGNYTKHRLIPDLAAISLQYWTIPVDSKAEQASLRNSFTDWMWQYIVEPHVAVNPDLLQAISNRVKVYMKGWLTSFKIEEVEQSEEVKLLLLQNIYSTLPLAIQEQMREDVDFLASIGLKFGSVINVSGLVFDVSQFWQAVSAALGGETVTLGTAEANTPATIMLNKEVEDGRVSMVYTHPENNQRRKIRIDHAGILAADADVQREDLINKQYWLDCGHDEFIQLVNKVAKTIDAHQRLQAVDEYFLTSSTVYYSNLSERLKSTNDGDPVYFTDLIPHSLLGFLRHFRLSLAETNFSRNYYQAVSGLLAEGDVLVAIQRIACFPIPLPDLLVEAFLNEKQDNQQRILEVLDRSQSPIGMMHSLRLRILVDDTETVTEKLLVLMSEETVGEIEVFLLILRSMYQLFTLHNDISRLSDELKLALTWAHTHYIYSIFRSIGHTSKNLYEMFQKPIHTMNLPFQDLNTALHFDVTNPQRVSSRHFILSILAYVVSQADKLDFTDSMQKNLIGLLYTQDENSFFFHPSLQLDISRGSNILGSILGEQWATKLQPYMRNGLILPSRDTVFYTLQESLKSLRENQAQAKDWYILGSILDDFSIDESLKSSLLTSLLEADFLNLYRLDTRLGIAATNVAFLQYIHLNSPELVSKLERFISELATFFAKRGDALRDDLTEDEFFMLIANNLVAPIFRLASTKENPHEIVINLSEHISRVWSETIPIVKHMITMIYERTSPELRPQYWRLMMMLYAKAT